MQKFLKFYKNHSVILILVVIGFLLRILNPQFGSPVLYVLGDEVSNYLSSLYMLSQKTFFSLTSQYPPLGSYIQIPFLLISFLIFKLTNKITSISDFVFFLSTHEGYFLFIPRIISGIFGSLSIIIVYLIAITLFPKSKSYRFWAAFLFTFSINHIQLSHLAKPWTPSLFFYLLSILFLFKSLISDKKRIIYIYTSAAMICISFGFLQIAFYAFIIFFITRIIAAFKKPLFNKENIATLMSAVICLITSIGFISLIIYKIKPDFIFKIDPFQFPNIFDLTKYLIINNTVFYFINQLITTETIMFIFSILALFFYQVWRPPFLGLTIYMFIYFTIMSLLFFAVSRYMLPIVIILPFYAALGISFVEKKINNKNLKFLFITIVMILVIFPALLWNLRFLQKPTFIEASEWINNHILPQEIMVSTSIRFNPFTPHLKTIAIMQIQNKDAYKTLKKYLQPNEFPENTRNIIFLEKAIPNNDTSMIGTYFKKWQVKYIVDYYSDTKSRYEDIFISLPAKKIMHFSPLKENQQKMNISNLYTTMNRPNMYQLLFNIERPGAYVDIWEITTN